jgi:lipopolysaccharide export system permease protein
MAFSLTLSRYFSRQFFSAVVVMLASLSGLVALFDFLELLRRAASRPNVSFGLVSEIAALKLPWESMQILPFAVLFGGILSFWRLTRSSELIVTRAAGLSAWQFLAAPLAVAAALGFIAIALISPLAAVTLKQAQFLDSLYLQTNAGSLTLAGGQLWVRQADHELDPNGVAIFHALNVSRRGKTLQALNMSVFRLSADDQLLQRIEAQSSELVAHEWVLKQARTIRPGQLPDAPRTIIMPTDLTVQRIEESFASPDTLSFWELPGFIALMERSGFMALRHRLHFQTLLALPVLAATMTLVAAGFSMRPARKGGVAQMIGSGVSAGFALFLVSKIAEEFGNTGTLPVMLAAWAPSLSGLMLAITLLLHLEDG